ERQADLAKEAGGRKLGGFFDEYLNFISEFAGEHPVATKATTTAAEAFSIGKLAQKAARAATKGATVAEEAEAGVGFGGRFAGAAGKAAGRLAIPAAAISTIADVLNATRGATYSTEELNKLGPNQRTLALARERGYISEDEFQRARKGIPRSAAP